MMCKSQSWNYFSNKTWGHFLLSNFTWLAYHMWILYGVKWLSLLVLENFSYIMELFIRYKKLWWSSLNCYLWAIDKKKNILILLIFQQGWKDVSYSRLRTRNVKNDFTVTERRRKNSKTCIIGVKMDDFPIWSIVWLVLVA